MFAKKQRLNLKLYPEFYKTFFRLVYPPFTIYYQPASEFKVAVIVSKKVSKKAVDRNLVKRRLLHALRHTQPSLPHTNLVIVAKPESLHCKQLQFETIFKDLKFV
jgi:ribonuclease P protein component